MTWKLLQTLHEHKRGVLCARFTDNGQYCLTGGQDKTIRLWNPWKPTMIHQYDKIHGYEIADIAIFPGNQQFASCGGDRIVFLWDVARGSCIRRFSGHTRRVNSVKVSHTGSVVYSGSDDHTVRIWDLKSRRRDPMMELKDSRDAITSIDVDEMSIVVTSVDCCVRTYDLRNGEAIVDSMPHPVTSVSISGDRNCLLVSTLDDTLRLFDRSNGELLNSYTGHSNQKYKIRSCFSHDDGLVFSGSENGNVYSWDLVESTIDEIKQAHNDVVTFVDNHPTTNCIISASADSTVKLWRIN